VLNLSLSIITDLMALIHWCI